MDNLKLKRMLREPIQEIFDVARYLDAAVSAHMQGNSDVAKQLFVLANHSRVREWTESIWGKNSPYVQVRKIERGEVKEKLPVRMPNADQKRKLLHRDGHHCRFCGIPVIRSEIRKYLHSIYPEQIPWGRSNITQHAGFQCLWLQYDHVIPHWHGGSNDLGNVVITCSACNYGKMQYSLEEIGLYDPRDFEPVKSTWDGLERVLSFTTYCG